VAASNALPPEKRAAVLADIKAGGKSCHQIAKDHSVAKGTVSRIAKTEGLHDAWDRTQTEAATRARVIDSKARREALKDQLIEDAERIRARAWEPYEVVVDNRQLGPQTMTLDLPPAQDVRAFYAAVGIAIDKHCRLEQYDAAGNDVDAKSMLGALAEGIRQYAQSTSEPEGADTDG
jgi:transposase-like protein